jgi:proline racemase
MGTQRATFSKLQRERAKKAKAAAKRERRLDRSTATTAEDGSVAVVTLPDGDGDLSAAELLDLISLVHSQLEAHEISFEEFEERKQELFARLPLD